MTAVAIVAMSWNASSGVNWLPSHSATIRAKTNCTVTATYGERLVGCVRAKAAGSRRMRPMAYQVRVVALAPALELAMAEFAIARDTSTQPPPHTARARPSQGLA